MYEAQAEKHQARYEEGLREYGLQQHQAEAQGQQQRRGIQPKVEGEGSERGRSDGSERGRGEADRQRRQIEREGERAERVRDEDVVMENPGGVAVGGFTSING